MKPNDSESLPNDSSGEIEEEEFEDITEAERTEEEQESSVFEQFVEAERVTPTPISESETQMESPVNVEVGRESQEWQSTYPGHYIEPEPIRATKGESDSHVDEDAPSQESPTNENSSPTGQHQQSDSESIFGFTQHDSKSDGSVQEDEILI